MSPLLSLLVTSMPPLSLIACLRSLMLSETTFRISRLAVGRIMAKIGFLFQNLSNQGIWVIFDWISQLGGSSTKGFHRLLGG